MLISLLSYRQIYMVVQAVVISLLFMLVYLLDQKGSTAIFTFLIYWNIITYGWVFYNELKKSPDFHPYIIFSLIAIQYGGISAFPIINLLTSGKDIYICTTKINEDLTLGFLYLTLEHYLLFLGYFLYDNYRLCNNNNISITKSIKDIRINLFKTSIYNYIIVLCLRLINNVFSLASISSLLSTYARSGSLVSLAMLSYLMLDNNPKNNIKLINHLYWIITILEIISVLGTGMKQDIITPLLPYVIYLFLAYKQGLIKLFSFPVLLRFCLLGTIIIGFVFPYISAFREIANEQHKKWKDITISEVLSRYINTTFSDEHGKKQESGIEYFMNRAGSIGANAFSINYANKYGSSPDFFLYTTSAIIPRFIWPDKPRMQIGTTVYYMALGNNYDEALKKAQRNTSDVQEVNIATGFIGAAYLGFGILGAFFFPFVAGYISARIWYIVKSCQYNFIAIWLMYSLILQIFVDYEFFTDLGFIFYVWSSLYIMLLRLTNKYYQRS